MDVSILNQQLRVLTLEDRREDAELMLRAFKTCPKARSAAIAIRRTAKIKAIFLFM